jgi:peptide chain release factor 2/peptide chain release factor
MPTFLIQISSGRGPVEVRRFVAALATVLRSRLEAGGGRVEEESRGDRSLPPASVLLNVEGLAREEFQPLIGTHSLIASLRGKGARKRWFVDVSLHEPIAAPVLDTKRLHLSACRAQGPGGQKVNKTSSAVRLRYDGDGAEIHLKVQEQRSFQQNRKRAFEQVEEILEQRHHQQEATFARQRQRYHDQLQRGGATQQWKVVGEDRRGLHITPA